MALHRRQDLDDIRSAYDNDLSDRNPLSARFSSSETSYQTAPTDYSDPMSPPSLAPPRSKYSRDEDTRLHFWDEEKSSSSSRLSVATYASTIPGEDDLEEFVPDFDIPYFAAQPYRTHVIPSTPAHFSELFPSRRQLSIRHDDQTPDGNLNLRVDTSLTSHGRPCDITLFHLRMHDLRSREFSLRRYCRDSGREVCRSASKRQDSKPRFHRSLSSAINSIKPKFDSKTTIASLGRNDSGYGSMHSVGFGSNDRPHSAGPESTLKNLKCSDTVKLEFSNYAHVEVKRTGSKGSKRYEFQYWGNSYTWKRNMSKLDDGSKVASYHLMRAGSESVLAYITPDPLSSAQRREEHNKGRWIMPYSMCISDHHIASGKDVADVVLAAGLIALVDDTIRRRFQTKRVKRLEWRLPKMPVGVDSVHPRRLIHDMFRGDV